MPTARKSTKATRDASCVFFDSPAQFRAWLAAHHRTAAELWVGFRKRSTGLPSMTWPESVDEALCYGWIDGLRRSIDATSYKIRFTPRRPGSIWSAVNTRRAAELIESGRMRAAGRKAYAARDAEKTAVYSYERAAAALDAASEKRFKADRAAWEFFQAQPPGYRKQMLAWVVSAKREETRARRLALLIALSAAGRRVDPMQRATN
jgi:uncharacterized protein YdeI (YjbR/CyaY-like superfamily)